MLPSDETHYIVIWLLALKQICYNCSISKKNEQSEGNSTFNIHDIVWLLIDSKVIVK